MLKESLDTGLSPTTGWPALPAHAQQHRVAQPSDVDVDDLLNQSFEQVTDQTVTT